MEDATKRLLRALVIASTSKFGPVGSGWAGNHQHELSFKPIIEWSAIRAFRRCDWGTCGNECCDFGAKLRVEEYDTILKCWDEIKTCKMRGGPSRDFLVAPTDSDYGEITTVGEGKHESCAFLSLEGGLGCSLHKWSTSLNQAPHLIKPKACIMFPLRAYDDRQAGTRTFQMSSSIDIPCLSEEREDKMVPLLLYKVPDLVFYYGEKYTLRVLDAAYNDLMKLYGEEDLTSHLIELICEK